MFTTTPNYLEKCVEVLNRTGADNVGGAARCRAKGTVQRAVCAALQSPLGFGGASFRNADAEGYVDTLFPGAFRREIFEKVGLFDDGAMTNEDAEINQRILQAGGRIYLSREIEVYYYPRDSLKGLASSTRYGRAARTLLKHGRFVRLRPAVPFLTLLAAIVVAIVWPGLAAVAVLAYALMAALEAARQARRSGASMMLTGLAFPIMHVCHAAGFGGGSRPFRSGRTGSDCESRPLNHDTGRRWPGDEGRRMCGIAGIVGPGAERAPESELAKALDLMQHRGPDAAGQWKSRHVWLGHRRLAIIDLSPRGSQPMLSPDSRFVCTLNGEIYNFLEIRSELETLGDRFLGGSDTEVLVHAHARWGARVLERLDGMFAFAIWDDLEKTILLARDRFGEKPLYYANTSDGSLVFASDRRPGARGAVRIDPRALAGD
jgi:hypothetical protein